MYTRNYRIYGGSVVMLCLLVFIVLYYRTAIGSLFVADPLPPALLPPPFTERDRAALTEHPSFAALVSYTNRGFTPRRIVVKQGDVVRFTNNASHDLWVIARGTSETRYPHMKRMCGVSSDFDSCESLSPRMFWQFQFDTPGVWEYENALGDRAGVVEVR